MDRSNDYEKLADSYFNFLAERFPVMCASDEFDFLPRAENAARHYDKLDQIDAAAIEETIDQLSSYHQQFKAANQEAGDLEHTIDLELLKASAAGISAVLQLSKPKDQRGGISPFWWTGSPGISWMKDTLRCIRSRSE